MLTRFYWSRSLLGTFFVRNHEQCQLLRLSETKTLEAACHIATDAAMAPRQKGARWDQNTLTRWRRMNETGGTECDGLYFVRPVKLEVKF